MVEEIDRNKQINSNPTSNSKILVVDDNEVDRELSIRMLKKNGFEVIPLDMPTKCIDTVIAEKPDLILLDIMMPGLDGNQVLQLIREKFTEIELPIIMVTSKLDASDVVESLKKGANDYITKPVQFEVALRRIHTHLTIAAQSKAMAKAKELEAIHAMIVTYNHEINNPLAIALTYIEAIKDKSGEKSDLKTEVHGLESAFWRISEMMKKTRLVIEKGSVVEYEKYDESLKMFNFGKV
ncbi:MAG: response regulator transcription factor [Oligoflexia bacterium]|nr:response regulator transcription factor [Oligoflexia bacterium]